MVLTWKSSFCGELKLLPAVHSNAFLLCWNSITWENCCAIKIFSQQNRAHMTNSGCSSSNWVYPSNWLLVCSNVYTSMKETKYNCQGDSATVACKYLCIIWRAVWDLVHKAAKTFVCDQSIHFLSNCSFTGQNTTNNMYAKTRSGYRYCSLWVMRMYGG